MTYFLVRCRLLRLRSAEGGAPYSINGLAVNGGMGRPIPYILGLSYSVFVGQGRVPAVDMAKSRLKGNSLHQLSIIN